MKPQAKIVLDSISPSGIRLTTMEITCHRFVLAEFNTHRVFSRNSASSRAIPVEKQLKRVKENTAWPIEYPKEQPGMQGGDHLMDKDLEDAQDMVFKLHNMTLAIIENYLEQHPEKSSRLHKSVINRYLEPYMDHKIIVTATEWDNFFGLRCNPMAQPEIKAAADLMKEAYDSSTPSLVDYGEWHTPYIDEDTAIDVVNSFPDWRKTLTQISAARCARVSYLTHDGKRDIDKDLELYDRLTIETPPHASPLEHVSTPASLLQESRGQVKGNLRGWHQLRHWGSK